MASLNGVTMTNYVSYETDRGIAYSAYLHINEEKIGAFENKGDGGCTNILISPEYRQLFAEKVKEYFTSKPSYSEEQEDFIEELINLFELEEAFLEKEGEKVLVETYRYPRTTPLSDRNIRSYDDIDPNIYFLNSIAHVDILLQKLKEDGLTISHYEIYQKQEDFTK